MHHSSLQRVEKELQICLGSKRPGVPEHVGQLLTSLRSISCNIMLQDFKSAQRRGVENRLWDNHGKVNNRYRKQLKQLRKFDGKKKVVEQRKIERHFLYFIKSSQRFYRGFIQSLNSHFGGIKDLEVAANKLMLPTLSIGEPMPATDGLQRQLSTSCHQTLIRLGDLSRWRETQLGTKDRNWSPAIGYYDLASRINSASGASHNQLAVIALQDVNHLGAVYHLYLAIAVEEPHPNAKDNLEVEFQKVEEAWSKNEPILREEARSARGVPKALVASFVRLHACYYSGKDIPEREELERDTLQELAMNLKDRSIDSTLSKMVLINIAAEYFAEQRLRGEFNITARSLSQEFVHSLQGWKGDPESPQILQSFLFLQRLNVRMFSTLLSILQSELERFAGGEPCVHTGTQQTVTAKSSAVSRRVLPALRQYSSWLMANSTILMANDRDTALHSPIEELWRVYAETLTLLAFIFPVNELEAAKLDYLLDEDEHTFGFSPFRHKNASRRYFMEDGLSPKPRCYDSDSSFQRRYPVKEMLGRIRDILIDGKALHHQEV